MQFTDLFIRRPVFASVLSLIILLFGLISYFKLPLRQFPEVKATQVSVTTAYPGASPNLIESQITTPIEGALAGVDGLDYISSTNTEGTSVINVNFKLGYNINAAVADVMNKVSSVRWELPKEINDPVIEKQDPNTNPILFISFTNPHMQQVQINDYLVRIVQPVLETLSGVSQAKIYGRLTYAMRIWLNPQLMAARGVTPSDVQEALAQNNLQSATGRIKNATQEFNTTVATDIETAKEFNNLVIRQQGNTIIRVKDIGRAELGTPERRAIGFIDGKQTNVIGVIPRSYANPLKVANLVKQELKAMQSTFPKGMKAQVVWDNSMFIQSSISEVRQTILEAGIFVILVIFLFLGSIRAVLIPAITIPLSLIGVCALMYAMDYSLNTITFLAFVLAIGMVVDDAIVVSENIHRQIAAGHSRFEAAIIGAREIRFAVIAMTLTLAAVYVPIIFMTGITGALFKEFALSLASAVIISGFIALTLSPMMCSKVLSEKGQAGKFEHFVNTLTDRLADGYQYVLSKVLKIRPVVIVVILVILASCYILLKSLPGELVPSEDMGGLMTIMTAPAAANIQYTEKYAMEVDKAVESIPEGMFRLMIVGVPNGVNSGLAFLTLKDWSKRKRSVSEIVKSLFPKLYSIPGVLAFPINPFRLPGAGSLMPINFVLKTTQSYAKLNVVAQDIKQQAQRDPDLANVDVDLKINKPQVNVTINRNLAGDLGVSMLAIGNALNIALGQPEFNRFVMNGRSYYVLPELAKSFRDTPQALYDLYVRTASKALVPLSSFVKINESVVPQSLNHFQQLRSATITGSPAPGYTLGQALNSLISIAKKVMPAGMQYDFSGESRQYEQESGTMMVTFIFAILFIFLVLSAQFESFIDPLIVMFSVPLSTAGALLLLKLYGGTLNIYTEIGLVTLIGLISKHGILMVEFANKLQTQGRSRKQAIIEAAKIRLRPILMTTAAMILGALPLVITGGAGANSRHQIGIVIIGGMSIGTLFTLFVVPAMYSYLASRKKAEVLENPPNHLVMD